MDKWYFTNILITGSNARYTGEDRPFQLGNAHQLPTLLPPLPAPPGSAASLAFFVATVSAHHCPVFPLTGRLYFAG
jgi:hypothetical protein